MSRGRPFKCPYCGSTCTTRKGVRHTRTQGIRRLRYCTNCKRKFTPKNQKPAEVQQIDKQPENQKPVEEQHSDEQPQEQKQEYREEQPGEHSEEHQDQQPEEYPQQHSQEQPMGQ